MASKYKDFIQLLTSRKVMTLPELSSEVGVTKQTIRAYMKNAQTISSFNKNGTYYVLPSTPQFDENGIWKYEDICFSKAGTLKQTFINLITNSSSGLNSKELGDLLLIYAGPAINGYRHLDEIKRENIGGRYIYFSSNSAVYSKQIEARLALDKKKKEQSSVRNEEGIAILVEIIKSPSIDLKTITNILKKDGMNVTEDNINNFLEQHSLHGATEFTSAEVLSELIEETAESIKLENLFPKPPLITFNPQKEDCSLKGNCQKTSTKTVYTLQLGTFLARNIIIETEDGSIGSKELRSLVAPKCCYGFDVIVDIGRMMFYESMQASEIQRYLATQNISISESGVEDLSKKYIVYLSILHAEATPKIVEVMNDNGGYILHLDALGANGGARLITGIDSITDIVLNNAKIPSENSDDIVPFLETIKERYGMPLRVVQDMGKGIMKAVEKVFLNTPILVCHFHFLRDIGKDLLDSNYDIIRKRLTHFGFLVKLRDVKGQLKVIIDSDYEAIDAFHSCIIEEKLSNHKPDKIVITMLYTLLEWILSWKNESAGYGFPFDRPKYDLSTRMFKAWDVLCSIPETEISINSVLEKQYTRIKTIVAEVIGDGELSESMRNIKDEIVVFDKLRDAMRIAPKDGGDGLNENNDSVEIETIESSVQKFLDDTKDKVEFSTTARMKSFFDQLEKYWDKLFADPITITIKGVNKIIVPQRTNNIMERFFREFSRASKRKSGSDNIGRMIRGMVADTPLVKNFFHEEYLKMLLDGKSLNEAFAGINNDLVVERMKEVRENDEVINAKIISCIENEFLPEIMINIAENLKSNRPLG